MEKPTTTIDIGALSDAYSQANEEGRWTEIANPNTGRPVGIRILVAGPYSKAQEKAARDLGDWSREHPNASEDELTRAVRRRFARGILAWEWAPGATFRGEVPELTMHNVERIMAECRWFYDQVVAATNESRGFIRE